MTSEATSDSASVTASGDGVTGTVSKAALAAVLGVTSEATSDTTSVTASVDGVTGTARL